MTNKGIRLYGKYQSGRWHFSRRYSKGASVVGTFEKLYNPMTGTNRQQWDYCPTGGFGQTNGQPTYNQLFRLRPND